MEIPEQDMTFDQLQRYRLAAEILERLRPEGGDWNVLDAGSRDGFLQGFLPGDTVVNLDRDRFLAPVFVRGDALALPFADGAFHAAVAMDVFEHLEATQRPLLLAELRRVASRAVVLAAPFASEEVAAAEAAANEFHLCVLGEENPFLVEHLSRELPRLEDYAGPAAPEPRPEVLANGRVDRWLAMTCLNAYLVSLPEPWPLIFALNRLYHRWYYGCDNAEPAYRHFLVWHDGPPVLGKGEGHASGPASPPEGFFREFLETTASDRSGLAETLAGKLARQEEETASFRRLLAEEEARHREDLDRLLAERARDRAEREEETARLCALLERRAEDIRYLESLCSGSPLARILRSLRPRQGD
nr:methyltransferase domain-containing protein [bacterium]